MLIFKKLNSSWKEKKMLTFKTAQRKKGFTLIEVLITAAVLLLTVTGFLNIYWQCTALNGMNRADDIAFNAAASKMEEITNSDISQIIANYNGRTYAIPGLADVGGQIFVTASQAAGTTDIFDVNITINWQQSGRNLSRTISTTVMSK